MGIESIAGEQIDPLFAGLMFNTVPFNEISKGTSFAVIGASGSGKESRGKYIARMNNYSHLESGDMFRKRFKLLDSRVHRVLGKFGEEHNGTIKKAIADRDYVARYLSERLENVPYDFRDVLSILHSQYAGLFVPDDLFIKYVEDQIRVVSGPLLLDGHIRTVGQADPTQETSVYSLLKSQSRKIDGALLVHANLDLLQERTVGRLKCSVDGCGKVYNTTAPDGDPQQPLRMFEDERDRLLSGYCAVHTDTQLQRRGDDFPVPVARRLREFKEHTVPALHVLAQANVPLYIVSGMLQPFSTEALRASVDDSLACSPKALEYFVK